MFERLPRSRCARPSSRPRAPVPAMSDVADHRLGDRQRAPGAAGEIDVVADVRACEPAHRRRRQRLQARERARDDVDLGLGRQRHARAVGQHDGDRQVAPAVAVGDQLLEGCLASSRMLTGRAASLARALAGHRPTVQDSAPLIDRLDAAPTHARVSVLPALHCGHVRPRPPRGQRHSGVRRAAAARRAGAVRDRRHDRLRARRPTGRYVGFTANSFNSVSLDPPLILWSLSHRSASLAAFEARRALCGQRAVDRPGRARAPLFAPARRPLRRRAVPARLVGRAADRRLRRVVRVPPSRAAPRRRPHAVHRRNRDRRAGARARPRVPARPITERPRR